jgi:hypothetical protein
MVDTAQEVVLPDGRVLVVKGQVLPEAHVRAPMPPVKPPRTEGATNGKSNQTGSAPKK